MQNGLVADWPPCSTRGEISVHSISFSGSSNTKITFIIFWFLIKNIDNLHYFHQGNIHLSSVYFPLLIVLIFIYFSSLFSLLSPPNISPNKIHLTDANSTRIKTKISFALADLNLLIPSIFCLFVGKTNLQRSKSL